MPSRFGTLLNQVIRTDNSPAEVNGVTMPFVAVFLDGTKANLYELTSLEYSIFCFDSADYASVESVIVQVIRNLRPNLALSIFAQEVEAETIYYFPINQPPFDRLHDYTVPIRLEPGANHTIALSIITSAPVVNAVRFVLCVRGSSKFQAASEKMDL